MTEAGGSGREADGGPQREEKKRKGKPGGR